MLLAREYLDEVKEHLRGEPAITFTEAERTLEDILSNDGDMEMLWVAYQKGVEDYSMEPDEAFRSAMRDELGITAYGPAAKIAEAVPQVRLAHVPCRCPYRPNLGSERGRRVRQSRGGVCSGHASARRR